MKTIYPPDLVIRTSSSRELAGACPRVSTPTLTTASKESVAKSKGIETVKITADSNSTNASSSEEINEAISVVQLDGMSMKSVEESKKQFNVKFPQLKFGEILAKAKCRVQGGKVHYQ